MMSFKQIRAKARVYWYKYRHLRAGLLITIILVSWTIILGLHYIKGQNWFSPGLLGWLALTLGLIGATFAMLAWNDARRSLHFLRGQFSLFSQLVKKMCKQLPAASREITLLIGVPAWAYGTDPELFWDFWEALGKRLKDIKRGNLNLRISIVIVSPKTLVNYMWNLSKLRAEEAKDTNAKGFFSDWIEETYTVLRELQNVHRLHPKDLMIFERDDLTFRGCIIDKQWAVLAPINGSPADCGTNLDKCRELLGSVLNFPARGFETRDSVLTLALVNVLQEFNRAGKLLDTDPLIEEYIKSFAAETKNLKNNLTQGGLTTDETKKP